MTAKMQTRRRLTVVAVLALLAGAALSGCAVTPAGTDQAAADPAAPVPRTIGPETLLALEEHQGSVGDWATAWQSSGCTAEMAGDGDRGCAGQLIEGQLLTATTAALFDALVDFGANTDETDGIARDAFIADDQGRDWIDAGCPGDTSALCADLTTEFVESLNKMTEEVARWTP